uniref:ABC transporter domain-containing protein n=1 Tax=Angiostrongylus cantonensis TaxID=6313 RepID=A0A0K0DB34_ANGCA
MVSLFHIMGLITTGQVGLCISYALSLTDLMNFSVRMMALSETNIVSVERIKEYHDIEREGPLTSEYPLIDAWPYSGAIEFRNFSIRYGNSEKLAVKNMTFSIKGGEKVAIIGRTGSGKTTIARGLLRLVEKASGDVFIDGVNIADLGLHELRTRITIIPQDPVLFSSTLRFNVDPFNQFPDSDVWLALEACQLKQMILKHKDGLMCEIEEGGKNIRHKNVRYSIGERQLALNDVNVQLSTADAVDAFQVVRVHFRYATVITIAHKLETIGECDRILVIEDGELVEFDTPENLLARNDSVYREMVETSKKNAVNR